MKPTRAFSGSPIRLILLLIAVTIKPVKSQETNPPLRPRPVMIRVASAILPGLVEHKGSPAYPQDALDTDAQGEVILKIIIDDSGKIAYSDAVEGDPLLVAAAAESLRDFKFRPYLLNGQPVWVESQVGFAFSIRGTGAHAKGQVTQLSTIPFRPEFRTGVLTDKGTWVLSPRKISGPDPQLPPDLKGKSGSVYLTITIAEDGKVQDVTVVGGSKEFVDPVVAAVKQFVYEPQVIDGKPAVSTTETSFHFGSNEASTPGP